MSRQFCMLGCARRLVLPCLAALCLLGALSPPVTGQDCERPFLRGDGNGDGEINISDAARVLNFLFLGSPAPSCEDSADTDDDGLIVLTDAVFLLQHLFLGGRALPQPRGACGADSTPDPLHCIVSPGCPGGGPGVDRMVDPENCGECGRRCADLAGPHVALTGCEAGRCFVRRCEEGFADADGLLENGCETRPPEGVSPAWLIGIHGERDWASVAATSDGSVWMACPVSWFSRIESTDLACSRDLANGNHGILLARYDGNGRLEWTRFAGGNGREEVEDLAVLPDGSAYITGAFGHEVMFGGGDPGETTLTSRGGQDVFLARFQADGKLAWARSQGGSSNDWGNSVAALPDGSCHAAGHFMGEIVLGEGGANEVRFRSVDPPREVNGWQVTDAFIARYSSRGSLDWASHIGGTGCNHLAEVKALPDGSAVVAGGMCNEAVLGSGRETVTLRTDGGGSDPFIARYGAGGSLAWAIQIHTNGGSPRDLEERADGSLLLLFTIAANEPSATFDRGGPGEMTLTGSDTFLAVYDSGGAFLWARGIAGGWFLGMLPDGASIVAGAIDKPRTFGLGGPNETRLAPTGPLNLFLARFEEDGEFAWARMAPGEGYQVPRDIAVLEDGSIYLAGRYSWSMTLFAGEPVERTLTRDTGQFLARMAGPRLGPGNGPPCSSESPAGPCLPGQACVRGSCVPRCAEEPFVCGPAVTRSSLPGVRIEFPDQPCRFTLSEVKAGIELEYRVNVDQFTPGVRSDPSSAESCGAAPPQSGLSMLREMILGGDQLYCLCDMGLCIDDPPGERDLHAGSFPVRFPWDGRNWYGPSDTLNTPGDPFPPGEYTFSVYARGTYQTAREPWEFEVTGTFGIELVPD